MKKITRAKVIPTARCRRTRVAWKNSYSRKLLHLYDVKVNIYLSKLEEVAGVGLHIICFPLNFSFKKNWSRKINLGLAKFWSKGPTTYTRLSVYVMVVYRAWVITKILVWFICLYTNYNKTKQLIKYINWYVKLNLNYVK